MQSASTLILALCVFFACTTVPVSVTEPVMERIKRENKIGSDLSYRLESEIKTILYPDAQIYLRGLAQKLSEQDADLQKSSVGILLLQDRGKKWWSFSLPGNRVYLSIELLKNCEFENEVAALIAFELAHLKNRDVLARIEQSTEKNKSEVSESSNSAEGLLLPQPGEAERPIKFFGPDGILTFDNNAQIGAVSAAVEILYQAGYDPRGLLSLWNRLKDKPEHSPMDEGLLDKLIEQTRTEITLRSPLRNPIVNTPRFMRFRKNLARFKLTGTRGNADGK